MLDNTIVSDIMKAIRLEETHVKQYRYRSARILHQLFHISREVKFENLLSEKSGKKIDNHTLYQVTYSDGTSFSIACSDSSMTIGLGVEEISW